MAEREKKTDEGALYFGGSGREGRQERKGVLVLTPGSSLQTQANQAECSEGRKQENPDIWEQHSLKRSPLTAEDNRHEL